MDYSKAGDSKGKGKASAGAGTGAEHESQIRSDNTTPSVAGERSMTSRVSASARGLAQDLFSSSSTASSLTDSLASSQASSGKSGPSITTSTDHSETAQRAHNPRASFPIRDGLSPQNGDLAHTRRSEDGSVEADHEAFLESRMSLSEQPRPPEEARLSSSTPWISEYHESPSQYDPRPSTSDGAEVVALLSSPNLTTQPDDPDPPSQGDEPSMPLPPYSSSISAQARKSTLNLIPISLLDSTHPAAQADRTADLAISREQWLRDWDGVLNSYSDEVWGDLLPLVQDAREEVAGVRNGKDASGALARLQMMVGHLEGPSGPPSGVRKT